MMAASCLEVVPSFTFWFGNSQHTSAIQVAYYDGQIELTQGDETIVIEPFYAKELFKEILGKQQNALLQLDKMRK